VSAGPPPLPPIAYPAWLNPDRAPGKGTGGGGGAPAPSGGTGGGGTPATYTLSPKLKEGLAAAWGASFHDGKAQEQGGILVRKADGSLDWRPGPPGTAGTFKVNYRDVKPGETLVASGHTHPYAAFEGGYTGVSFGGHDIGNMAYASRPDDMKFVRSGDSIFMVQETQAFKDFVAAKGETDARAAVIKTWDDTFAAARGTFQEKVEAAVKAVCKTHGLDYCKGSGDTLTKVDVTK
jgi:hypothetical protein